MLPDSGLGIGLSREKNLTDFLTISNYCARISMLPLTRKGDAFGSGNR